MTDTVPAADTGLPIALIPAEPIPGLVRRPLAGMNAIEAAEQARAMNAILAELNAILETDGGAHA